MVGYWVTHADSGSYTPVSLTLISIADYTIPSTKKMSVANVTLLMSLTAPVSCTTHSLVLILDRL